MKTKKLLAVLLAVVMLLGVLPGMALADDADELPFTLTGINGEQLEITVGDEEVYDEPIDESEWMYSTPVYVAFPDGYDGNTFKIVLDDSYSPETITIGMQPNFLLPLPGASVLLTLYAPESREAGLSSDLCTYEVAPYTHVDNQKEFIAYYSTCTFDDKEYEAGNVSITSAGLPVHFYTIKVGTAPVSVTEYILDATSSVGQWENLNALNMDQKGYFIVPYGCDEVAVTFQFADFVEFAMVNGMDAFPDEEWRLTTLLSASPEGMSNEIVLFTAFGEEIMLNVVCISQKYTSLPDSVDGYLCIGSQYTNRTSDDYGLRPVRSLVGSNYSAGGGNSGPVSLGNFGGYITYYFEDAITDNPNNPYGIDFITFGNCVEASNEFAEPGQVWVSEDGDTWYALAGAMHYEDYAIWDYMISYIKTLEGTTMWMDSLGGEGFLEFEYPLPNRYPYHNFDVGMESEIDLCGILFLPADGIHPHYPGFGYTDVGRLGTILSDENAAEWSAEQRNEMLARNISGNPYLGTEIKDGREHSKVTDGMDLAWAVDSEGQSVDVSDMEFHYVKIVTASNIDAGAIGEKSTEVNMVRVARANDEPVGKTAAPASITVDGDAVDLTGSTYSAVVDGPFKVAVEAPEGANVYINNTRASSVNFGAMPLHRIVRVIVQEGEKEPAIYVINLTETTETPEPAAALTLDANGGTVNGSDRYTLRFDANMAGDPLPEPVAPNNSVVFGGWYVGQLLFTGIPAEVKNTTLTALWVPKNINPDEDTITVTFRLIGSTLADGDIRLGDGDYHGAEYVTWIPTTEYTVPANATVADLFLLATEDAGISSVGAAGGYVSTVYAPEVLGGYELSEFTNGPRSGWMYTMDGEHTNAVNVQTMHDGAEIVFHYVNDYAWEVEDWAAFGGS